MSSIPEEILRRKGARDTASVPAAVRRLLNRGEIETVNLCEALVVDTLALARAVLPRLGLEKALKLAEPELTAPRPVPLTAGKRSTVVVRALLAVCEEPDKARAVVERLAAEKSDVARGWACELTGLHPAWTLAEKLEILRPLAADSHMNVRENAWLAARPAVAENLENAVALLLPWTRDERPGVRRLASEVTRPRGVWCKHIESLKRDPSPGLPLLEPLRADPSPYVRNSVGNWLNDASRTRPDWVRSVCARWESESPCRETAHIVRRALRTLRKAGKA